MADTYYTDEITAVPFGLLTKSLSSVLPSPAALVVAAALRIRGLMGWPLKPTYAVGELGSERNVAYDAIPPRALSRWAPILEELRDLGFAPLKYSLPDMIGEKEQAAAYFLDETGSTIATLEWMRMRGAEGIEEKTPFEFNSYAKDDPEIMTGSVAKEDMVLSDLLQLDFVDLLVLPNHHRPSEIYQRHLERTRGRSFYQMTPEAAVEENRVRTKRRFEWVLNQSLLRPLSPAEVARVREMWLE